MSQFCYSCMEPLDAELAVCPYCGAATRFDVPVHMLRPGTLLDGRYRVGRALGQGGFGITYIGRDETLDMRVAIKEYYPNGHCSRNHQVSDAVEITDDEDGFFRSEKDKFLHEAKTLAKFVEEPGIVDVRDFFEENGTAYIVMEYLNGITLKEYIDERGPLPISGLLDLMRPIISALAKVHEHGVIHRDISPDNILLLPDGRPKLIDFGAAREISEGKSVSVMLKRGYAPEEQYRRKGSQGPWTDVYALCATMYFCLTGRAPEESIERFWNDDDTLLPPTEAGAKLSPRQEAALLHGMAIEAQDRTADMKALEAELYPDAGPQTLTSFTLGQTEAEAIGRRGRPAAARPKMESEEESRPAPRKSQTEATRKAAAPKPAPRREQRETESLFEEELPPRKKSGVSPLVILIVLASLALLFFAGMLARELLHSGATAPQPTAAPAPNGGDDTVASVVFVDGAPQGSSVPVDSIRLYRNGVEIHEGVGFTMHSGDAPVTLTAQAYTNAPASQLWYSWAASDSGALRLTPGSDSASCVCEMLHSVTGGITLTVSCSGKVVSIPVYLEN